MELGKLAQDISTALAPALPYLVDKGKDLAKDAATKIGNHAWQLAQSLWGKLRDKLAGRPGAAEVIDAVAESPADQAAVNALAFQLRRLLQAEAALAEELARMLAQTPRAVTASGERSVAIGGDARNSVIITGDGNRVGRSGGK